MTEADIIKKNGIMNVVYSTLNRSNTPTKQHAFIPVDVPFFYEEGTYLGNQSICGRFSMIEDGGSPMEFRNMDKGVKSENNFCKNCQRIIDRALKHRKNLLRQEKSI